MQTLFSYKQNSDRVFNSNYAKCNDTWQPVQINKRELSAILLSTHQNKYSFVYDLPEREMQWLISQVIDTWLDANQSLIKGGMMSLLKSTDREYDDSMIDDDDVCH
jgi:hypothetical protein